MEAVADITCASSYYWEVQRDNAAAREFNARFSRRFNRVPSDYAGYAYSGVTEILETVKRVTSTDPTTVAKAMGNHSYSHYKGAQFWRACDHQSIQSVYLLKGRTQLAGPYGLFEVLSAVDGTKVIPSCETLGHKA